MSELLFRTGVLSGRVVEVGGAWQMNPYRLASMLDMLEIYADEFVGSLNSLRTLDSIVLILKKMPKFSDDQIETISETILRIENHCKLMGLSVVPQHMDRMMFYLKNECQPAEFATQIDGLWERFSEELNGKKFRYIPADKEVYYSKENLFGKKVKRKFTSKVSRDISEAGKCIATARPTAAVFHLMRVMEVGVQKFAAKIGASALQGKHWRDMTWGEICSAIRNRVNAMPKTTASDKESKAIVEEELAHLDAVKNCWRNKTMHPHNDYREDDAIKIFQHVRSYMQHLAEML